MMTTYLEPDHGAVEIDFVGFWRIWNGKYWTHGFKLKEQAVALGRRCNGTLVGQCVDVGGQTVYANVEQI